MNRWFVDVFTAVLAVWDEWVLVLRSCRPKRLLSTNVPQNQMMSTVTLLLIVADARETAGTLDLDGP